MLKLKDRNTEILNDFQIRNINKNNQELEYKKNIFDIALEKDKYKSNMKIQKLKTKKERMQVALQVQMEKLRLQPIKNAIATLKQQNDYNKKKNEARKKEIPMLIKNSKIMSLMSFLCSIFSGSMTCISILDISNLQVTIFQSIIILFCAIFENYLLKQWNKYYNDFFEKNNSMKMIILVLSSSIILIYTAYSIKTNFDFWNKSKIDMCGRIIISCIFDLMAICFAFISDEYFYLNFNKKKEEKTTEKIEVNKLLKKK